MNNIFIVLLLWCSISFGTQFYATEPPLVHDFAATSIDSTAWFSVLEDTTQRNQWIEIFQTSGENIYLGVSSSILVDPTENEFVIFPTGNDKFAFSLPIGSDIFFKAVDASGSVTSGKVFMNFYNEGVISSQ